MQKIIIVAAAVAIAGFVSHDAGAAQKKQTVAPIQSSFTSSKSNIKTGTTTTVKTNSNNFATGAKAGGSLIGHDGSSRPTGR